MAFNVKAVMFDLDGTLIHTAPEIAAAINDMRADLALPGLPQEQIQRFIGEGAQMLIKRSIAANADDSAEMFEQAQALFFSHYAQTVKHSQP